MKAIQIKVLSSTNTQGTRLKASIKDEQGVIRSKTEARQYNLEMDDQVKELAQKFIKYINWDCEISGIGVFAGDYYITLK